MPKSLLALLAIAAALLAPSPGAGQGAPAAASRPLLTLVAGYAFGFDQSGTARVFAADRLPLSGPVSGNNAGGWLAGVRLEVPVSSLLTVAAPEGVSLVGSVLAGGLGAGEVNFRVFPENPDTSVAAADTGWIGTGGQRGASILVTMLGLAFRVPVQVPASLTVAPALVRLAPRGVPRSQLDRDRAAYHPGVGLGASVDLPTRVPGLSVRLGVDDYLTFPNAELAERVERGFRAAVEPISDLRVSRTASHLLIVQLGASLSF